MHRFVPSICPHPFFAFLSHSCCEETKSAHTGWGVGKRNSQQITELHVLHVSDGPTASYSRWHVWWKNFSANYWMHFSYSILTDWCCAETADWGYFFHSGKKCINKNIPKWIIFEIWNPFRSHYGTSGWALLQQLTWKRFVSSAVRQTRLCLEVLNPLCCSGCLHQ